MSENRTTMAPQAEGQAPEFDAIVVGAGFSGLYMLHSLRKQGCPSGCTNRAAEPAQEAEDKWVAHHDEVAAATLLLGTDSWWVGANIPGKPRTLYPYVGGVGPSRAVCQEVAEKGFEGLVLTRHDAPAPAPAGG